MAGLHDDGDLSECGGEMVQEWSMRELDRASSIRPAGGESAPLFAGGCRCASGLLSPLLSARI
jgi:hypothetical protein